MNDFTPAMDEQVQQGTFYGFRAYMMHTPPDMVNPSMQQRVTYINQMRRIKGFTPHPAIPDPAAQAIAEMRSLAPPQAGMLLCTVPPGRGMLSLANGGRYVFWTESKYTIIAAQSTCISALMMLPCGPHRLAVAAYGCWDRTKELQDPLFADNPLQYIAGVVQVQPGTVTEIIPVRQNVFEQLSFQVFYH